MSIFLTGTDTRHSLLHKQKIFRDKTQTKLTSNSSKLTGGDSHDAPIDVDSAVVHMDDVPVLREEDDDQVPITLDDIPDIKAAEHEPPRRRPKRRRQTDSDRRVSDGVVADSDDDDEGRAFQTIDSDSDDDELFVQPDDSNGEEGGDGGESGPPPPKRRKDKDVDRDEGGEKKKMAMDISYEGFAIYGRVLCLVVKRRDGMGGRGGIPAAPSLSGSARSQTGRPSGQAMMENWITSTQIPDAEAMEDETT